MEWQSIQGYHQQHPSRTIALKYSTLFVDMKQSLVRQTLSRESCKHGECFCCLILLDKLSLLALHYVI
jgi:aerobic-type carbon monoxide dehydrogenase small subunit (CoxS/CutS family)